MSEVPRLWINRAILVSPAMVILMLLIRPLAAAPADEVRATFDHFVAAQNAHDLKAVQTVLLDSPDFLWITRGTPLWGTDAALKRFATLYEGTWHLDPEAASLRVTMIGDGAAQLYIPIMFTIGPSGQSPPPTRFLMNQLLVKTTTGWKISTILPIPAPAQ